MTKGGPEQPLLHPWSTLLLRHTLLVILFPLQWHLQPCAEYYCDWWCSHLPEGAKTRLAARLTPQMVPPGHDLCQEGDDADCLWILQEGDPPLAISVGVTVH